MRASRWRARVGATLMASAVVASACGRANARLVPDGPPLVAPPPPPRVVESPVPDPPVVVEMPTSPRDITEPRRVEPPPAPPRPPAPRIDAPRPPAEPSRADAAPEPPRQTDDGRGRTPSPLQGTPTERERALEASIRDEIRRANGNLNRVDYRQLNADARDQYTSARTLIQLAEEALRARNLVFARSLADKAQTLSAQLAGR